MCLQEVTSRLLQRMLQDSAFKILHTITAILYLPTLKPKKQGQMGEKSSKIGTFLNFLYITTDRFWQK